MLDGQQGIGLFLFVEGAGAAVQGAALIRAKIGVVVIAQDGVQAEDAACGGILCGQQMAIAATARDACDASSRCAAMALSAARWRRMARATHIASRTARSSSDKARIHLLNHKALHIVLLAQPGNQRGGRMRAAAQHRGRQIEQLNVALGLFMQRGPGACARLMPANVAADRRHRPRSGPVEGFELHALHEGRHTAGYQDQRQFASANHTRLPGARRMARSGSFLRPPGENRPGTECSRLCSSSNR